VTGKWNSLRGTTLTFAARKGQYPGMLTARRFTVVLPDGTSKTVDYAGSEVTIKL
jgi:alpha-D-xyloside xylohydrolase